MSAQIYVSPQLDNKSASATCDGSPCLRVDLTAVAALLAMSAVTARFCGRSQRKKHHAAAHRSVFDVKTHGVDDGPFI